MWNKIKKGMALGVFIAMLGAVVGAVIWILLWVMNLGIGFLWTWLPAQLNFPAYGLVVCGIGGIFVGLLQKNGVLALENSAKIWQKLKPADACPMINYTS